MRFLITLALVVVALAYITSPTTEAGPVEGAGDREYIVLYRDNVAVADKLARLNVSPRLKFASIAPGFSARLNERAYAQVAADPDVLIVAPNRAIRAPEVPQPGRSGQPAQIVPSGVARIGTRESEIAKIDGKNDRMDVDVAILDSGIYLKHSDLRVAGGFNCTAGSTKDYDDRYGHGTHVAGTVGAIDNKIGDVGVAPGARLWAIKVLGDDGFGTTETLICGLDWVAANATRIEVANLSLVEEGSDDGNCGLTNNNLEHFAVCQVVSRGVTVIASAGNDSADASGQIPAAYDEVITVSAMSDIDGKPGGLGEPYEGFFCDSGPDDVFTDFSNFGADVDIAAPGYCIDSTWRDGFYAGLDGTSMAAPHVSGAAALYKIMQPSATPAEVKLALLNSAEPGPIPGDPDSYPEGVVNVRDFD